MKTQTANADEDGSGTITVGDTLTYQFDVENTGTVTLTAVTLSDVLPGISGFSCGLTSDGDPFANGSGVLEPGETVTCTATYVVTQDDAETGSIHNIGRVGATDPGGTDIGDIDEVDTPVVDTPVIGVAKAVRSLINNGDGSYTVTFDIVIENLGDVRLVDLELTDDIVGQFAGLAPSQFAATDGTLVADPAWSGGATENILAAGQTLDVGESGDVSITFTFVPGSVTFVKNTAVGRGESPGGTSVEDDSTDGANPDPNDDDDPTEDDPTPVDVTETPGIGVAKRVATDPVMNDDGTATVTYVIKVENTGDVPLSEVQVTEDLTDVFAPAPFTVDSIASADFTVDPAFDGTTVTTMLDGTDSLGVDVSGEITLVVTVDPGANPGPYMNQVTADGRSPADRVVVDDSENGTEVDPDGNDDPTDNDTPTPVTFPVVGRIDGRVWYDGNDDGVIDGDEDGIGGVTVELVGPGPDGVFGTDDDEVLDTVVTDPDGNYSFEGVAPGDYQVHVDDGTLPGDVRGTFDPDGVIDGVTDVTVGPDEVVGDIDFGYVEDFNLRLTKTAGEIDENDEVTWTIVVRNDGPGVAPGPIVVTDVLPSTLDYLGWSASAGWSCATTGGTVECVHAADMDAGAVASIEIDTTVVAPRGSKIVNSADVISEGPLDEPDLTDNIDEDRITTGELPRTGGNLDRLAIFSLMLLLLGAAILATERREPRTANISLAWLDGMRATTVPRTRR